MAEQDQPISPHNHSLGLDCTVSCPRFVEILNDIHQRSPGLSFVDESVQAGNVQTMHGAAIDNDLKERAGLLGEVIDRRQQVYGDAVTNWSEVAEMWTIYLGFPVQAHQAPMMMVLLKILRSKTSPDYSDHVDDMDGYLDIFRQVIGPDMIQARSVAEYIEKKWPGES